jgi:hypothetical protein
VIPLTFVVPKATVVDVVVGIGLAGTVVDDSWVDWEPVLLCLLGTAVTEVEEPMPWFFELLVVGVVHAAPSTNSTETDPSISRRIT